LSFGEHRVKGVAIFILAISEEMESFSGKSNSDGVVLVAPRKRRILGGTIGLLAYKRL